MDSRVTLSRATIEQFDSQHMLSSIEVLEKQCGDAWRATSTLELPAAFRTVNRVVLFGMGGSALGMDVIKQLFTDRITVPIEIVNDYTVPAYVNEHTLAVLSTYSGTTEEVVEVAATILQKTPIVFAVTTGGALAAFTAEHGLPTYIINPTFNPSNQPRMAVGYSVMGIAGALVAAGLLNISQEEVARTEAFLQSLHAVYGADTPNNPAQHLAAACMEKMPVLISSEHATGSAHVFTNQLNENAKHFAVRFAIPELNHHLIEALSFPERSLHELLFVLFESSLYHPRNQKRYAITKELLTKNRLTSTSVMLQGGTRVEQAFEVLLFGSYVSLYLAVLHQIDPSPIPNVQFLKEALEKSAENA